MHKLSQAKCRRNQIYFLRKQSSLLWNKAFPILQEKWQIDEKIRKLMREQEALEREFFEENNLIKRAEKKDKKSSIFEQLREDLGFSTSELVGALQGIIRRGK